MDIIRSNKYINLPIRPNQNFKTELNWVKNLQTSLPPLFFYILIFLVAYFHDGTGACDENQFKFNKIDLIWI